jgi:hypothetical protein
MQCGLCGAFPACKAVLWESTIWSLVRRGDWSKKTAYAVIKFTVPPSQSDAFEEAWCVIEMASDLC